MYDVFSSVHTKLRTTTFSNGDAKVLLFKRSAYSAYSAYLITQKQKDEPSSQTAHHYRGNAELRKMN